MFVLFLVFGTISNLKQSLWTLKLPKNILEYMSEYAHIHPRSLTWIPKRMVWKMYLRLQEWLFCVIMLNFGRVFNFGCVFSILFLVRLCAKLGFSI